MARTRRATKKAIAAVSHSPAWAAGSPELRRELAYHDGHLTKPAFVSLCILTFVTFLGNFTQLQLTSALPQIDRDFHIPLVTGQWLTSIIQLIMGIMVPLTAFLTERFSTRKIIITSMSIFTIGSFVGWIAPNFPITLLGRTLEAIGGGVLWPVLQIVIFTVFPITRRGFAMGVIGMAMAVAPAIGPVIGGWQTDANGWRSIFGSLGIIGALSVLVAALFLRNFTEGSKDVHADFFSVILSTIGFGGLLYGFTNIRQYPITAPVCWAPMAVGIVGIVWFVTRQLTHTKPLLNLRVLKNRAFMTGTLAASLSFFAFSSIMVILPQFIQNDRGYSATISGLTLLPGAIGQVIAQSQSGRALDRFGARPVSIFGTSVLLIGTVMMSFISMTTPIWWVSVSQFTRQIGMGCTMMPLTTWALNSLPREQLNDGSAVTNTLRQISGAIGSPVLILTMEWLTSLRQSQGVRAIEANVWGIRGTLILSSVISFIMLLIAIFGVKGYHSGRIRNVLDLRHTAIK
jgi:DHA2 family lincomycin resistance protein-like MFS transporter